MKVLSLLGLVILTLTLAAPLKTPPFVRKWTQFVGDNASVITVRDGLVYYYSNKGVGAVELRNGNPRWSNLANQDVVFAVAQNDSIYAMVTDGKTGTVLVIDLESHQIRTLVRLANAASTLAVDSRRVYLMDNAATLRAYDQRTGAFLWSRRLSTGGMRVASSVRLVKAADVLYVGLADVGEFGVDAAGGSVLWKHPAQYAALYPAIAAGGNVITQHSRLRCIQARTGAAVWEAGEADGDAVLVGNVLIGRGEKQLVGRDVHSGRLLWKLPLRDADSSYVSFKDTPDIVDGESAWLLRQPVLCVTKGGKEKWNHPEPFTGTPFYADSQWIVTVDEGRLLGYVPGKLPPLPTTPAGKRALAERLAAQFEQLDNAERRQLKQLAPFSFRPLLNRYVGWVKASAANRDEETSYSLYCLITDSLPILQATCNEEDTRAIVGALADIGKNDFGREELEQILEAKGKQDGYIPTLVRNLRKLPFKERGKSAALTAVAHSPHPQAVALMLEALRDPKAAPAWRQEAFQHLAGTGNPKAIGAVRNARPRRGPRKPWFARIDLARLERRGKIAIKTDKQGRAWMLFHSAALGNDGDLFIVEKRGGKWGKPLFTGAWTMRTFESPAPTTFRGIPLRKLVDGEWIKVFPNDAAIRQDSDRDGLTDVVEARLGTDKTRPDTDGDGLSDLVDPCPNAAPRSLNDAEKIVAACIEARFFEYDWGTPAILSVDGMKPFELYGYASTLLWQVSRKESPMSKLYGGGVNILRFHYPDEKAGQTKAFIRYSRDRKTAHTIISRYSGGLNGSGVEVTLKKIGDEWFVVDLELRYIS